MNGNNVLTDNVEDIATEPQLVSFLVPVMQAMTDFLHALERTEIQYEIKDRIRQLLHVSIKYEQESAELIRLVPTEGLMSYGAKMLMTTVMNERYLHAPPENHAKAIRYPDIGGLQEVYGMCRDALKSCLKADFVNIDPLAGLQVMQLIFMAYAKPGELILGMSPEVGGHECSSKIADSLGRQIEYLPFDYDKHIVDIHRLDKSKNPSLIYIDHSNILRPHDLYKIKEAYPAAILCFDISQVFASVAGEIFPNPLQQGADIEVGSTHKSLNGPQKAIMATNCQKYDDIFRQISAHFVSNNHPGDVAALAMTLLEFQAYGKDYARQMVDNANALARALANECLPVYALSATDQYTYSSHVWIDCEKVGHAAEEIAKKLYEETGIVVNTLFLPKGGIHSQGAKGLRLGTTEVTRIGMKEEQMTAIAKLIAGTFEGIESPADRRKSALELRCKFPTVEYCIGKR